ncbi:CreA family protein [Caldimonas aquatica]|uniref:CreA family protein n=1 Tax=Caldimonas aquatica TaxID=376175 RepID=A0ABY6MSH2_9BURK|nr:CreA family protein [Schlegelella aquatica]UZD54945.1 CreA family protein [Schlegelella aquatica]
MAHPHASTPPEAAASRLQPARWRAARAAAAAALAGALGAAAVPASAEELGSVDTVFKFIGPDHKIVVEAYDDPKVSGVTCYVSRARTGGIKGALGLAEDKSEASIACRQVGPIGFAQPLPVQEEVFSERMSILFKRLRIVRMVDRKRNALVYLTYSERVIEGSPQNSVTAVPVPAATPIPVK